MNTQAGGRTVTVPQQDDINGIIVFIKGVCRNDEKSKIY
jgi:beta-galactosidase/beta-glucuronidase